MASIRFAECARNLRVPVGMYLTLRIHLSRAISFVNVLEPRTICTKGKQRAVTRFMWAEGMRRADIPSHAVSTVY
jgi:hypothetical protein